MAKTRSDGEGSLYPRHIDGCPKPMDAKGRPTCKCPWQGAVVIGYRNTPDGRQRAIRRKVSGPTRAAALSALADLRQKVGADELPAVGKPMTVEQWMNYWYKMIAPRRCKPNTLSGYKAKVDYINELIGHYRLDRLTPEHIEDAWDYLLENGSPVPAKARKKDEHGTVLPLAPNTVHQAHRILARALKVAVQRKRLKTSPCDHMDAPSQVIGDLVVPTDAEVDKILATARGQWNAARWSVALALGLRQGEALGLRWDDIDLDEGVLHVRQSLMRVTGKGIVFGTPKSETSKRSLAIPPSLLASMKAHRKTQNEKRLAVGDHWTDSGLVFTLEDGRPIDPSVDARRWRKLLAAAEVRHYRLHDARHAAGTMLVAQGVDVRVAMAMLGHSSLKVTMRYQHVVDQMVKQAADAIDLGGRWA